MIFMVEADYTGCVARHHAGTSLADLSRRQHGSGGSEDAAAPDGSLATGDVATIDANGYGELVGRSKNVIKSGGEWTSSIALENIAVSHPDLAEAAVINAKHERWQEQPLLLVVPRAGHSVDVDGLMQLHDGAVAKWWYPDAVAVVDALPHGATGKLNKLALRQKYQNYQLEGGGADGTPDIRGGERLTKLVHLGALASQRCMYSSSSKDGSTINLEPSRPFLGVWRQYEIGPAYRCGRPCV